MRPALCLALVLLAGCRHLETHYAALGGPGSVAAAPVESTELHVGTVAGRPFAEQGLVQAIGYGGDAAEHARLGALREEGRRRGCDAVVRTRVDRGQGVSHAIGVCVRWQAPAAP
ncbi:MAG: hypothetical protein EOO75_06190 [Myxococcales bacterium]|nr:MAG: hypothetical protein EOO75_06190 [Myxococcales bacterium]